MITPELRVILVFLTSLISTIFLIPKLARIATRIGLVDHPAARKIHSRPLPLVGGIAMVISATFSFLLFIPLEGLRGYFIGMAILLLIGFLDDYSEIGHREKFLAQVLATSILMYLSRIYLQNFGDLLGIGDIVLPANTFIVWGVTVFCVVGVTNAVNLIDGLDGLAGGFSFVAFLTFAALASLAGNTPVMLLCLALLGAVMGFLRFNWVEATIFMGDAGSLCLGFSLALVALVLTQGDAAQVRPVVPLLVLAVPVVDTLTVMIKRILRGQSPFKSDRYHLHHIFIRYGMPRGWAVRVIIALCTMFSCVAVLSVLFSWPDWLLFAIFIGYFIAYVVASFYIITFMRVGKKMARSRAAKRRRPTVRFASPAFLKIFRNFKIYQFIRKSRRFPVAMQLEVAARDKGEVYAGDVINISNGGLMANIPELQQLLDEIILKVIYEKDGTKHFLELPARHVWLSSKDGACYHGFEFLDFDGDQDQIIFRLLVRSKQ